MTKHYTHNIELMCNIKERRQNLFYDGKKTKDLCTKHVVCFSVIIVMLNTYYGCAIRMCVCVWNECLFEKIYSRCTYAIPNATKSPYNMSENKPFFQT